MGNRTDQKNSKNIKQKFPEIPIIGFPKGANLFLEKFINGTGVDGLSIDSQVPILYARDILQEKVTIQGNLDPILLLSEKEKVWREVKNIKNHLSAGPFIFNLGHGFLPNTKIENVEEMIAALRDKD